MTVSAMIVSRDPTEISVFECILGGLHIAVEVEADPQRARVRLAKSKIDALIADYDLGETHALLNDLQRRMEPEARPVFIVSGSNIKDKIKTTSSTFVVEKPVSVDNAVRTLSAARNLILQGRLRYHRQPLEVTVSLSCWRKDSRKARKIEAHLLNLSRGGCKIRLLEPKRLKGTIGINFVLPGMELPFEARVEIAWSDTQGNAGVRMVDIKKPMQRDLRLWLEREFFRSAGAAH
jgi:CheY-like chemotaxis protein